jgi:NADP-dependent 3-hydroxy acid dehydrogenase YdfG
VAPLTAVYSLTKFGVNAFSEALRQEVMQKHLRVSVVEPGTVDTELGSHVREGLREAIARQVDAVPENRPARIYAAAL